MNIGDYVYYIGKPNNNFNYNEIYLIVILPLTIFGDILNIGLKNNNNKIEYVDKKDIISELNFRKLKINKILDNINDSR